MAELTAQQMEARSYAEFAVRDADPRYRSRLTDLYEHCHLFVSGHLGGAVSLPHLRVGQTAPRSLAHLAEFTGHGATWEITINERLVMDLPNRNWVQCAWPAPGLRLFARHLLERYLTCQYVREVEESEERGYAGFGPRFCALANRIRPLPDFRPVIPRRRGDDDADALVGKGWPVNVEMDADPACYGDDLKEQALALAVASPLPHAPGVATPPTLGVWQFILRLLADGRHERLREMAVSHVDRLQARGTLAPVLRRFETGAEDENGEPIRGETVFDPEWLRWDNGTVYHLVRGIHEYRAYADLFILADALEMAGCGDAIILRHLRARTKGHDSRCWVLQGLLATAKLA